MTAQSLPGATTALREDLERVTSERDALQALADQAHCSWCGHIGPKTHEAMYEHVMQCEKRPEAQLIGKLIAAQEALAAARRECEDWRAVEAECGAVDCHCGCHVYAKELAAPAEQTREALP